MDIVQTTSEGSYDLSSEDFISSPDDTYKRLLKDAPWLMYKKPFKDFLFVSKYKDVSEILKNKDISSDRIGETTKPLPEQMRKLVEPLTSSLSKWILFLDPPKHTSIRKVISAGLSKKMIDQYADRIRTLANELAKEIKDKEDIELVSEFCFPLPAIVISELLGADANDREKLKVWSKDVGAFLGRDFQIELFPAAQESLLKMNEYFATLVEKYRENPSDNLMSALLSYQEQEDGFSDEDLVANCTALMFGGHETTTNLISISILNLLTRKEVRDQILSDKSGIEGLLKETLRFDSPVQRINRVAKADIDINGVTIEEGQDVYLLIGAANRDPEIFENPEVFDITRENKETMGFGYGRHLCPGAYLSMIESRAALDAFISAGLIDKKIKGLKWQNNLTLRGLESLQL